MKVQLLERLSLAAFTATAGGIITSNAADAAMTWNEKRQPNLTQQGQKDLFDSHRSTIKRISTAGAAVCCGASLLAPQQVARTLWRAQPQEAAAILQSLGGAAKGVGALGLAAGAVMAVAAGLGYIATQDEKSSSQGGAR